jgi:hypothetical protein
MSEVSGWHQWQQADVRRLVQMMAEMVAAEGYVFVSGCLAKYFLVHRLYRVFILCDKYRLSLPVVLLNKVAHSADRARARWNGDGEWQVTGCQVK